VQLDKLKFLYEYFGIGIAYLFYLRDV